MALAAALLLCLVTAVSDGDTLHADCDGGEALTVRVHAIDAPESGQPQGRNARRLLARLALHREVELRCVDRDRYGRAVCAVQVPPPEDPDAAPSLDAGEAMLEAGLAWWYRQYAEAQTAAAQRRYAAAEARARRARVGLWKAANPTPPWQWRREQRERELDTDRAEQAH
ncbi:endonuclease YncB(thermonuclease family) [Pseudacidovorax sp. 1753]|uniref:thermonuclease family protein n=1 Tax=unclassified Pseudacidovorax TaxID=2620592 RepID=UPI001B63C51C|nr:thermonuclease family protein [Pseudacidovorax sp.]MBP6896060.1 thermonuclease family protein [Pseudacidovorax sp.]